MSRGLLGMREGLPKNKETNDRLIEAMIKKELPQLAQEYAIKRDHFWPSSLRVAAQQGYLDQVTEALRLSRQHLTLEDFSSTLHAYETDDGTLLHEAARHGHLDQVAEALKPWGEKLTLKHFKEITGFFAGGSVLRVATEKGHLDQVNEILKASGEPLTFQSFFEVEWPHNLLHSALEYGHLDQARAIVRPLGQDFTLEQLVKEEHFWSPARRLDLAAQHGYLDQVLEAAQAAGEKLTAADFLGVDEHNRSWTALKSVIFHKHLDQLFIPSYWAGRLGEMEALWRHVPEADRAQIDYEALRKETILLSVQAVPRWGGADFARARRRGEAARAEESGLQIGGRS